MQNCRLKIAHEITFPVLLKTTGADVAKQLGDAPDAEL
jgi:hypothetical protein